MSSIKAFSKLVDAGVLNFGDFLKIYVHVNKIQNIDLKADIISLKHPYAQALHAHIKNSVKFCKIVK